MPENVAYIWASRAQVYCNEYLSLPAPTNNNIKLSHREIANLHNAGFRIKDIAATVPNPPKARALDRDGVVNKDRVDRPPHASLEGRFSERDQNYRERLGVFSPVNRVEGSKKSARVYEMLQYKSIGQLFHVSNKLDGLECHAD